MRIGGSLLTIALLTQGAPAAHTTADGLRAYVTGDYAAAARILRPLAEDAANPDPLAQFFVATMYRSGRGVDTNLFRACGLYLNATTPANPLMAQARALAEDLHQHNPYMLRNCKAAALHGWTRTPTMSFALDADHQVRLDDAGFTIRYHGETKRVTATPDHAPQMGGGGAGFVYLPFRHTALDVSRPIPTRRHFMEVFVWMPDDPEQPSWRLFWFVYEIAGLEVRFVTSRSLSTFAATRPPTSVKTDLAGVYVNATGEAQWIVFGTDPVGDVIPFLER